jgi:phosphoesterase RecJ-like protein
VLSTLGVDEALGLSWLSMNAGALEHYRVRQEDLDGIVEHARSIAGTRMALFFRDLGYGKVKVSFRSTGEVDVNDFARLFGGGGHAKASGALIAGSLDEVRERVIAAAHQYLARPPRPVAVGQATAH